MPRLTKLQWAILVSKNDQILTWIGIIKSSGGFMWIWEHEDWHRFTWDSELIEPLLRTVRLNQGKLIGKLTPQSDIDKQAMLDALLNNILHSSAIENERLNTSSVRSSLAKKLGISEAKPYPTTKQTDGLAEVMLDAIQNLKNPLSLERLLHWHQCLFPIGESILSKVVGGELRGQAQMQVVSGRLGKEIIHFEAPPRHILEDELNQFITWFNESQLNKRLDPLLRAAIAHLWFVTLHPFEDGNGRITRFLTDLALAQAESLSVRFYAMSVTILERRESYYAMLESTQKGMPEITNWLEWFLNTLNETFLAVMRKLDQLIFKTHYWLKVDQTKLTLEQVNVLNRMLDGDFEFGINTSQYAKVAKVSKATATRHLSLLVELECLEKSSAGGRSTKYSLPRKQSR